MGKFNDLTGQRFSQLAVISRSEMQSKHIMWDCACDCGIKKTVRGSHLTLGKIKSCGCIKQNDLSGNVYGKLEVLHKIGNTNYGSPMYECLCECGNISQVQSSNLLSGSTRSCGCIKIELFDNLIGRVFGRITIIGHDDTTAKRGVRWFGKCECGNEGFYYGSNLKSEKTLSCGCFAKELATKHGHNIDYQRTSEYQTWYGMLQRCNNPESTAFENYGGRGIIVEWNSFEEFYKSMGDKPSPKHTIERKSVNGNYCKENCSWEDRFTQAQNTRLRKTNKTGIKGCHWNDKRKKFVLDIGYFGNKKRIGYFDTIEEAAEARRQAELKYWNKSS